MQVLMGRGRVGEGVGGMNAAGSLVQMKVDNGNRIGSLAVAIRRGIRNQVKPRNVSTRPFAGAVLQ